MRSVDGPPAPKTAVPYSVLPTYSRPWNDAPSKTPLSAELLKLAEAVHVS